MSIGIIICDRYRQCEGGKCFRSVNNRESAFRRYSQEKELSFVAYASCDGCPGGRIENSVKKMKSYGAEVIHFATVVLAGYPPCPFLEELINYVEKVTNLPVIVGTHPMPTNYIEMHTKLGDWTNEHKMMLQEYKLLIPSESKKYDSSKNSYNLTLAEELEL